MNLFPDANETIAGISNSLQTGDTTCVKVVQKCLDKIDRFDGDIHAWIHVDRDGALELAEKRDAELSRGERRGALHGIPVGIKDIIDVEGWPTTAGFEPWANRAAKEDAEVVARLKKAGAIILGKTVTTQFACYDPPPTCNPWKLDHTPGGSSSGSAAAVAAGMCLTALGTQTGGSITRPASFCGIAGMKPSFGKVSLKGVVPLAYNLDHVGPLARSVTDLNLVLEELAAEDSSAGDTLELTSSSPRLGLLHGIFDDLVAPETATALERVARILEMAGASVDDVEFPVSFDEIQHSHHIVMAAEAASFHESIFADQWHAYGSAIRSLVTEGLGMPVTEYVRARRHQEHSRKSSQSCFARFDALLCPAALGPAPDTTTTGNPAFNIPWSYTGLPTITFPMASSKDGLPMGLQLVGRAGGDSKLLNVATWCERVVREASEAGKI